MKESIDLKKSSRKKTIKTELERIYIKGRYRLKIKIVSKKTIKNTGLQENLYIWEGNKMRIFCPKILSYLYI